ncbi:MULTISPECIES: flagellar basal body rod C-terminal domain-containing protein [Marinobacter]|uniref:flagellar basal body rod C-terminal domain-containing protein n=1 Tax=Marinobacter TaxID=2742 RepID=UPI000DABB912|nr:MULTISPECIES: flagellar basal body rod C-terminal domain-containing protein [Marinobacter]
MINNSFAIGIQGIQDGMMGVDTSARKIARAGTDGPQGTNAEASNSLAEPIVDMQLYARSVEASAQVVKTADETVGTLLDVMA